MKRDEGIKRFFLEYQLRNKILPYDLLPEHLQKIQNNVLISHDDLDKDILVRILAQIRYKAGEDDSSEQLLNALTKVNSYR